MNWTTKWYNIVTICLLVSSSWSACQETAKADSRVERLPYYHEASFTPQWLTPAEIPDTFHRVSPFRLVNQMGDTITEKTFADKIYVTDFFFTSCPGICPKMMNNMHAIQDEFIHDKEVLLLSHSVTPRYDSVAVLKAYAESNAIDESKWHLVTGEQLDIYKLGRKDYFVEESLGEEKEIDEFLHTENFVLIDKNRHIRGIYNGLNMTSVNQLIADIKTLKKEEG
ncbi:MAG: SCO family protein [Saprospiraceae bacterium]